MWDLAVSSIFITSFPYLSSLYLRWSSSSTTKRAWSRCHHRSHPQCEGSGGTAAAIVNLQGERARKPPLSCRHRPPSRRAVVDATSSREGLEPPPWPLSTSTARGLRSHRRCTAIDLLHGGRAWEPPPSPPSSSTPSASAAAAVFGPIRGIGDIIGEGGRGARALPPQRRSTTVRETVAAGCHRPPSRREDFGATAVATIVFDLIGHHYHL
ncbi:hypothetical protein OsI_38127 [Oryza sativa Indica Group]|uniref:Uncharacterized protein n=1 Tax=Oryza sativa subsp. indica TaxID=39946 RepID=B8BPB8_ORYSI|nr:hypothetical protein OsI_38127 [Oryza sativa Indica Group]